MYKKKICVVTTSRADYGLLNRTIKKLNEDPDIELSLLVSGSHLSSSHGFSHREVDQDFSNNVKIDILTDGDTPLSVSKSAAKALTSFAEYFSHSKPDLLLLLGDRFEIMAIANAALIAHIPIAHFHGGEVSMGVIDDAARHCITKMSAIHFTATEIYRHRVIQLGESPDRVFCVGAPGLEAIENTPDVSRDDLEKSLKISFSKQNLLLTFHPVTLDQAVNQTETQALFTAVEEIISAAADLSVFITAPNLDTYSKIVIEHMDELKIKFPENIFLLKNIGSVRYINLMKQVDAVVGNSSSGIIEAPYLKKAVVNVGTRQSGRLMSEHILNAKADASEIASSIRYAVSSEFQSKLPAFKPYYDGGPVSEKVVGILKNLNLNELKTKRFHDVTFNEN